MVRDRHESKGAQGEVRQFKGSTVFDWDAEPADERPSEFARSTGYSGLSSYSALDTPAARRASRRGGSGSLWVAVAVVIGLSVAGILALARLLHHG
jgi:hypothetical protein